MKENALLTLLQKELESDLQYPVNGAELYARVQARVSYLLAHDFQRLIQLLYRIDVDERKLKQWLKDKEGKDAAAIISTLIIDRQSEKLKHRQHYREDNSNPDNEEKW